ncbi:divergent polysaccharide deacetylase family protein [Paenibacillus glycinis]|uniref:Divergent polysaccharide deacetylase family protein n=1 Tax=Paenibacillus glycinis TaxID=2697035 RepID=A0ABW9XUU1_9BACL|nr:divergent polysaccharide deacetylase family protein [Paenibacillus glycinis]NBD26301.1 divergent polysaccharide deacetylase family protein [Paenibacillus glycinis]
MNRKRNKKIGSAAVAAALCLTLFPLSGRASNAAPEGKPTSVQGHRQVAIVIDDFGNGMTGTPEMMALPVKFTTAIMPFMPTTKQDAELAHKLGDDVIVHMPMEPVRGKPEWLGPGAITTAMSDAEIRKRVEAAIADVPYAVGMNNHMGSKATADERVMRVVLTVVKEKGLFFLDSRTTYKTVLPKLTAELGVPLLSNQVFLDDVYSTSHITKQLGVLREYLKNNDSCVTIGHVGPPGKLTAAVLKSAIPRMQGDTQFVKLSEMVVPSAEKDVIPHP